MEEKEKERKLPWGLDPSKLEPNSLSSVTEDQLKTLMVGKNKKTPFQKYKEEQEAKKKKAEEEAAQAYADFVESFQSDDNVSNESSKSFLHGETVINSTVIDSSRSKKEYKPPTNTNTNTNINTNPKIAQKSKLWKPPTSGRDEERDDIRTSNKNKDRYDNKRAIDELKEELKKREEERSKIGARLGQRSGTNDNENEINESSSNSLYITNIPPQVTEQLFWKDFGKYGTVISVKIIPPKTDDDKRRNTSRNTTYGFVTFTTHEEAELARSKCQGKDYFGCDLKVGWGKPFKLNNNIPSSSSIIKQFIGKQDDFQSTTQQETMSSSIIVTMPVDQDIVEIINATASFVLKYGIQFEKIIMEKESNNYKFSFLKENNSNEHNYYRWKLYSLLQGDSIDNWRSTPFQMTMNGTVWTPPSKKTTITSSGNNKSNNSVTDENKKKYTGASQIEKDKHLTTAERDQFEDLLRNLTIERKQIKEAMGFCLDHADVSFEIIQIIVESLTLKETAVPTKLARLYLVSDILHNSSARVPNASSYRTGFETHLLSIFDSFRDCYKTISGRITAENFKDQVLRLIRIWEGWSLYSTKLTIQLQHTFLGVQPLPSTTSPIENINSDSNNNNSSNNNNNNNNNSSITSSSTGQPSVIEEEEDIDGVPI